MLQNFFLLKLCFSSTKWPSSSSIMQRLFKNVMCFKNTQRILYVVVLCHNLIHNTCIVLLYNRSTYTASHDAKNHRSNVRFCRKDKYMYFSLPFALKINECNAIFRPLRMQSRAVFVIKTKSRQL